MSLIFRFVSVFLLISGVNMLCGTCSYLHCITSQRENIMLSRITWLFQFTLGICHVLLWLAGVSIYLGLADDEEQEELKRKSEIKHV
jgi:hypothetical protein